MSLRAEQRGQIAHALLRMRDRLGQADAAFLRGDHEKAAAQLETIASESAAEAEQCWTIVGEDGETA